VLDELTCHCANPGHPLVNRIVVPDAIKHNARIALQRMLDATEVKKNS
jgi:quinolinate synthase